MGKRVADQGGGLEWQFVIVGNERCTLSPLTVIVGNHHMVAGFTLCKADKESGGQVIEFFEEIKDP